MQKREKKRIVFVILLACFAMTGLVSFFQILWYRQVMFQRFSVICQILIEEKPQMEQAVLSAFKEYQKRDGQGEDFLLQHGYMPGDFLTGEPVQVWIIPAVFFMIGSMFFLFLFFSVKKKNRERIGELTAYLEQINSNGTGMMIPAWEDEFSILQDEIYKTVTNLYQTRDAALHAKENYADNLANIAHQLKTPISAASLSLQLLKEEMPCIYTEQAQRQIKRLHTLELALLTLSRIDSGTLKMMHVPVDIYTALSLAADNLYSLLSEKEITIQIPEHKSVSILGDMEWTMEAFLNLMKNCIEHSPKGGIIYCEYSANPFYTEICIRDQGKGFSKKDLPHLFERFYRGENAAGHGIGIGLAIAKAVFSLQNGSITAGNLPEGGAYFEIRIYSH